MIGYLNSGSFTQSSGTTQSVSGSLYLGGIGVSGATGDYWQNGGQNTVGTLYFGGSGVAPGGTYHLAGGTLTAGAINLGASGAATVALSGGTLQAAAGFSSPVPLTLTSTSTIDTQSYSPTLSGAISGSGSFNKIGSGTLTLTGANSYAGATTVSTGVLNIQNGNALGTTAAGTTVAGGAALQIQGGITTPAEALTLNGTGVANDGALRNISGNNTLAGAITLASAARINSDSGTLTISPIVTANNALTIGGSGNTTISASFGNDLKTLTKDGSGTLTVNGSLWVGYVSGASATLSNGASERLERDDRLPEQRQFHAKQRNNAERQRESLPRRHRRQRRDGRLLAERRPEHRGHSLLWRKWCGAGGNLPFGRRDADGGGD